MRVTRLLRPRPLAVAGVAALSVLAVVGLPASASTPGADIRVTNDDGANGATSRTTT